MSDQVEETFAIPRLTELVEFRFLLRSFLSFSEAASESFGISAQQYQLMQVVGSLPEGQKASVGYLAERMILRHNSTVELVDRAERAGLVRRQNDESDLRRSLIELTSQGQVVLKRLVELHLGELDLKGPGMIQALTNLMSSAGREKGLAAVNGDAAADADNQDFSRRG